MTDAINTTDATTCIVVPFPKRYQDSETEIADTWRAWIAEADILRDLYQEQWTREDADLDERVTTLELSADAKAQRILDAESSGAITQAARIHMALEHAEPRCDLSDYGIAPLAACLRDLLPLLPDDMAERLEPLTAENGKVDAALEA
ncbi:hypothetical protein [Rhodospirillaceae bacterium SYSU D60014]|uniref:hypothetical protein n=1 Tax=Virgifigura deserti TaxID=2268457 RepID=UPI0013C4979B